MIIVTNQSQRELVLSVIEKYIESNLYLYIDVCNYELDNENIKIWYNENLSQIALKYYNSFQLLFTKETNDFSDIISLILEYKPNMISGTEKYIQQIHEAIANMYSIAIGYVLQQKEKIDEHTEVTPILATTKEAREIAELICLDKSIGGHYTVDELEKQLTDRLQENKVRNYIITDNNKIIAHYATYAEMPTMGIMGGLIVHPESRGNGYAKILHTCLSNDLLREGKNVYLFCQSEKVLELYLQLGAIIVNNYAKLTKK